MHAFASLPFREGVFGLYEGLATEKLDPNRPTLGSSTNTTA